MRFRFLLILWGGIKSFACSNTGRALLCGVLGGFYLVSICQQLTAQLGTSLPIVTGMLLGIALGLELPLYNRRKKLRHIIRVDQPRLDFGWTHFGLACWTVMIPWTISKTALFLGKFGPDPLTRPQTGQFLFALDVALLAGITAFGIMRLAKSVNRMRLVSGPQESKLEHKNNFGDVVFGLFLFGLTLGILFSVFSAAPILGVSLTGIIAALVGGAIFVRCIFFTPQAEILPESEPVHNSSHSAKTSNPLPELRATVRRLADGTWSCLAAGCFGAVVATVMRMIHQLFPVSSFLVYVEWAAIIGGVALGWLWMGRRMQQDANKQKHSPTVGAKDPRVRGFASTGILLFTAAWCVCLLTAFSLFVDLTLLLNASVLQVWLQLSARSLLVTAVLLPFGIGWGFIIALSERLAASNQNEQKTARVLSEFSGFPQLHSAAFAGGFLFVRWIVFGLWGPVVALIGLAWLLMGLGLARWIRRRPLPRHWAAKLTSASAVCFVAAAPLFRASYDPARSAKLLFATNVFVSRQRGVDPEYLMHLDEGRLISSREGERGTLTAWKYRGTQFHFRENGIPKAIVSSNLRLCPQYTTDAMQAIIPLVMHESPREVLILGMGSGVPLTTSLSFPVQKLTCVESDPQLLELLDEVVWSSSRQEPLDDDRVRLLPWDPTLAVIADRNQYDVIISNPNQAMLLQSTPYYTLEFYQRVSRRLKDDGIFCQRFQQVDFGVRPLQILARTLQSVFDEVIAIESGAGELLLLGSNSSQGIARDGLLDRLQAPQVRRTLGELGWDWTVPLNLAAYRHQSLAEFSQAGDAGINTAANGRFAFGLPQEVMRWGAKWQELQQQLTKHVGRLLKWDNAEEPNPEIVRRLEEVVRQREYMTAYPDQYWAYRKLIMERIIQHPRNEIVQVKGESPRREMHPEDKRRLKYFEELGKIAKKQKRQGEEAHQPQAEEIRRIAEFTVPYDPMISYFLHQEVAELYARCEIGDPEQELVHRLHAIHYAHPQDRSVKNVAAALNFLVDHPQVTQPWERFDHLNALCQILKTRWKIRGGVRPKSSRIVLNDIEQSLTAIGNALDAMDSLGKELKIPEENRRIRRKYLEVSFVRPMRSYRIQLHQHYLRQEATTKRLIDRAVKGDSSEEPNE
jgi:hypothetical protein